MPHQPELAEYPASQGFVPEPTSAHREEPPVRSDVWVEVRKWRMVERERLIGARLAWGAAERQIRSDRIAGRLDQAIGRFAGRIVGTYWPFRGEPDLRDWGMDVVQRGGRLALPVAIRKGWPLEYRIWTPGDPLERDIWNIFVPSCGPAVQPDVMIAPVVGFDKRKFRLGYGGGFFDRTLAAMTRKVPAIGVGYAESAVATIHPQPHDIPMDVIVTD